MNNIFSPKQLFHEVRYRVQISWVRHQLVKLRHLDLGANDVFLASYPKSGNTWLRHLLTHIITGQETKWRGSVESISNIVGKHSALPGVASGAGRLIKTHEPYRPAYKRAVLLVRDARDVAVSEYFFQKNYSKTFGRYKNSFELFLEYFLAGKTNGYLSWQKHVESWLNASKLPENQILVLSFEQFKSNTSASLRDIVDFLGVECSDSLLQDAITANSVESLKRKENDYWSGRGMENRSFVRSGGTGSWKSHFTPKLEQLFWDNAGKAMEAAGYKRIFIDCDA